MKILVTGSNGFIGYNLCQKLLKESYYVIGVDNNNPYYDINLKRTRKTNLIKSGINRISTTDIKKYNYFYSLCESEKPDCIIHLAAQAGVRHSIDHPFEYEENNLKAFLNVLEVCRHLKIPKLIYASSSSVYGNNILPFAEFRALNDPRSLYAATKQANESMAAAYSDLYGIHAIGLRFFTVYGPWGRPDMAMWKFIDSIYGNKPIQLYNNGNMYRDFTYIDDIVDGIIAALKHKKLKKAEIFNLGSGKEHSIKNVVEMIALKIDNEPIIEYLPMQPGDINVTLADIDRACRVLGYNPRTKISDGIDKFIEWYKEYHGKD
jgi:UDP-glucuronate 4-epimerase